MSAISTRNGTPVSTAVLIHDVGTLAAAWPYHTIPVASSHATKASNAVMRAENPKVSSSRTAKLESISKERPVVAKPAVSTDSPTAKKSEQACHACRINARNNKRVDCHPNAGPAVVPRNNQKLGLPATAVNRPRRFGKPGSVLLDMALASKPRNDKADDAKRAVKQVLAFENPTKPRVSLPGIANGAATWRTFPAKDILTVPRVPDTITSTGALCPDCRRPLFFAPTVCASCTSPSSPSPLSIAAAAMGHISIDDDDDEQPPRDRSLPKIILTTPEGSQIAASFFLDGVSRQKPNRFAVTGTQKKEFLCVPARGITRRERVKAGFCDECATHRCQKHWRSEKDKAIAVEDRRVVVGGAPVGSSPEWLRMGARVARRGLGARRIRINGLWYYEDVARAA
ncbi:hypothetical protein ACHAQH_005356 [Verticillium albo-atrum]